MQSIIKAKSKNKNVLSHEANIDINKRLVSFDISKLDDSIRSLGMMVVMENIWDRVAKNRVKNGATIGVGKPPHTKHDTPVVLFLRLNHDKMKAISRY